MAIPLRPTTTRRPPVDRPRPGVPQHIRRRRARFAVAIILLLAVTIGAIGWWLGSGRWTTVPSLTGKQENTAIGLLQEAGLDPSCCTRTWNILHGHPQVTLDNTRVMGQCRV